MSKADSIVIAIDGPSASGKSTVAKKVAEILHFYYVDSGAFYRAVTWKCLNEGLVDVNQDRVGDILSKMQLSCVAAGSGIEISIDNETPGLQLRSGPVRERVSQFAALLNVRDYVLKHLHALVKWGNLVMEGRDIATVVFPDTPYKYYLDADPQERARRRHNEILQMESESNLDQVLSGITKRDQQDSSRKTAPLQIALGAEIIDTTSLNVDEVADLIVKRYNSLRSDV